MAFLLKHLTTAHSGRPGFNLSCGLNGCLRTFGNITTYKHHVYAAHSKYHTNLLGESCEGISNTSSQEVGDEGGTESADNVNNDNGAGMDDGSQQNQGDETQQAGMLSSVNSQK